MMTPSNFETVLAQLRTTLGKMEVALGNITEGIVWVTGDGRIQWCNRAFDKLVGCSHVEVLGSMFVERLSLQSVENPPVKTQDLLTLIFSSQPVLPQVFTCERNAQKFFLKVSASLIQMTQDQNPSAIFVIHDVTETVHSGEALRVSEERYHLATQGANDGLWDWDLASNYIYYSPRFKTMLGYAEDEFKNLPSEWFDRIHPDDAEHFRHIISSDVPEEGAKFEMEYRIKCKDESYRWMLMRCIAIEKSQGRYARLVGWQTDIHVRKQAEEQLRHDAFHDKLTQLPNRALFIDRLENSIKRVKRHPEYKFAVLFIDLDRFKVVNDSLGHLAGDQLLVSISQRLKKAAREGDTVARLGGDEFVVLIEDVESARDAMIIAERMQKVISSPIVLENQEVFVTSSIGIVLNTDQIETSSDLLRDADNAMYRSKSSGGSSVHVFDKAMHTFAVARLNLESDLRRAITNNEFVVYYQPIISLKTGKIIRFEALVRWMHPKRGLVPPLDFIPLAEETGMILQIGEWVLNTVCYQAAQWEMKKYPQVNMAINFSAKQFQQPGLPNVIKKILADTQTQALALELEITESVAMKDIDFSVAMLNELKSMGIQLAIDDFGIGYSSLSCLKLFPLDSIKIDRTFIRNLPHSKDNVAISSAIIAMGHNLGLKVVAEGIETSDQLNMLKTKECDEAQGYLFSRPVSVEEAEKLLKRNSSLIPEGSF
jgi:diguanylate cyclase (GGDEF)-like protein/PAS domain S-box-containing protein